MQQHVSFLIKRTRHTTFQNCALTFIGCLHHIQHFYTHLQSGQLCNTFLPEPAIQNLQCLSLTLRSANKGHLVPTPHRKRSQAKLFSPVFHNGGKLCTVWATIEQYSTIAQSNNTFGLFAKFISNISFIHKHHVKHSNRK